MDGQVKGVVVGCHADRAGGGWVVCRMDEMEMDGR